MNLLCGPPSNLCVSAFNGHFNPEAANTQSAAEKTNQICDFLCKAYSTGKRE